MPKPGNESDLVSAHGEALRRLKRHGQEHLLSDFDVLAESQRRTLLAQIAELDLELLDLLLASSGGGREIGRLEPLDAVSGDHSRHADAVEAGRDLLASGGVGFVTVAGGQATRLGIDIPKGCFPIGPVSGKTLYEWQAEMILAAEARYGRPFPWAIMVSPATFDETRRLFEQADWFGLWNRVTLVFQRVLPAVDPEGRILREAPGRIALAPNGHGGVLEALGGALDHFERHSARVISYFQVDNPLVNPADPAYLGHFVLEGAEMAAKVVEKTDPLEKAGIVALLDGLPSVVEYSELPEELAIARDEAGRLRFRLASIAAHLFTLSFLRRVGGLRLPYHRARKSMKVVDSKGRTSVVEADKFECFVFDAIPRANGFLTFLADRLEEFEPLKNSEGANSPETVAAALLDRTRRWYTRAGRTPPPSEQCELSPLDAYDYETFLDYLATTEPRS